MLKKVFESLGATIWTALVIGVYVLGIAERISDWKNITDELADSL